MWVEARSGAGRPGQRSVAGVRVGDVIAFGHAGRRDRCAAGAVSLRRALRRGASLGRARRLVGGVRELLVGRGPALLELDARRGMAVRLVRGALPTPAGADRAALPPGFGERVLPLLEAA